MKRNFYDSYPVKVQERTKKNLVWILIFSICMMFAGFTSAYIVSIGGSFWVKVNLPMAFFISTAIIILSSITLFIAMKFLKKNKAKQTKLFVIITLILGIGFGAFQFIGYKTLIKNGAFFVSHIIVDNGRYGDYYEIKKDGKYLTVENNQYYFEGNKIEGNEKKELQSFASQFLVSSLEDLKNKNIKLNGFSLLYKGEPLNFIGGEFLKPNGDKLIDLDFERLYDLCRNITDDRVDFFVQGELGKDFKIYYNKNELDYQERTLMYKGQPLSANLQNKLLRGNNDTSTSYFYIITALHLLHVAGGIIMLIIMTTRLYTIDNKEKNIISLKAGSIFWHFLGILWLFLLLFLLFIH